MKSDTAKVLHKIAGRPMLHWIVTAARAAGAERVVAILGHQNDVGEGVARRELRRRARSTSRSSPSSAAPATPCSARCPRVAERVRRSHRRDPHRRRAAARRASGSPSWSRRAPNDAAGLALLSTVPDRDDAVRPPRARRERHAREIVEHPDATPEQNKIKDTNAGFYAIAPRPPAQATRRRCAPTTRRASST